MLARHEFMQRLESLQEEVSAQFSAVKLRHTALPGLWRAPLSDSRSLEQAIAASERKAASQHAGTELPPRVNLRVARRRPMNS